MSLQDILMERAALHFQNTLGPTSGGTPSDLFAFIAETVKEEKKKKLEKEEYNANLKKSWDEINRIKNSDKDRMDYQVEIGIDAKGNIIPSFTMKQKSQTVIPQGMRIKSVDSTGKITYEPIIPGLDQLTPEQQVQARSLARRLYGVRGTEKGLPEVVTLMAEGKSVDQIEDSIRFSGQSQEFSGTVRNAAQQILTTTPVSISEKSMDYLDDLVSSGKTEEVKNYMKKLAMDTSGTEQKRSVLGKERTVEFLEEIQDDLDTLEKNGIDTNIFTGTIEDINKKIGRVKNPELRNVATKISVAVQNYRRSMSGVAFSVPESKEYKDIFPGIGRTANFNRTNIDALKEVMQGDLTNFYSISMGPENYKKLFGEDGVDLSSFGVSESLIDNNTGLNLNNVFSGIGGY